jgi:hypothetical protein
MIKKAFVTVMAAGTLSLPLAGVAWGDESDPGADGLGRGGVPVKIAEALVRNGGPVLERVIPGTGAEPNIFGTSDIAKLPGSIPGNLGSLNPGSFVKAVTPGCASGTLGCQ